MTPLAQIREVRGLKMIDVAKAVSCDKGHYSNIEAGKASASPQLAARIASFFGHAITELQILYPERYVSEPAASEA